MKIYQLRCFSCSRNNVQFRRGVLKALAVGLVAGLIAACSISGETRTDIGCEPTQASPNELLRGHTCGAGVGATFTNSTDASGLNAFDLSVDLSGSTMSVDSSNGWSTISVKLEDGSLASTTAQWTKVGSEIILTSPAAVESWLDNLGANIKEFDIHLQSIEVTEQIGTNVFSAEFKLDQQVIDGASTSWYVSPNSGCGGIFPDPQLCY